MPAPRPPPSWRYLLLALWLVLGSGACLAVDLDVWIPRDGPLQQAFIGTFQEALARKGHRVGTITDLSATPAPALAVDRIVVALGRQASQQALDAGARAVLSVLVSRRDAQSLVEHGAGDRLGAIVLDQPLARRLAMLRILAPEVGTVSVLASADAPQTDDEFATAITAAGYTPRLETIEREQDIVPALERILTPDAALLATPDPGVFNRDTVMSILLTSYRHRRPVIGFTAAYVRAGAVAGVFSTPEDIALQAAELIGAADSNGKPVRGIHSPERYQVAVNDRVSRSLGLPEITEEALLARLRAQEAAR
ncbi:MAG: hypothetical protein KDG55_16795 [Rhodocyclaceae bacterium]|nr:hypothetical protein [Rhodocyclaceae bacterium]